MHDHDGVSRSDGSQDALLVARYGRRRAAELLGRPPVEVTGSGGRRRARALLGAAAGIAVIVGWVGWASQGHDPGSVSSQQPIFATPGVTSVSVTFSVSRPVDTPVSCVLDATDLGGSIVGRAVVRVPGTSTTVQQVTAVVRTTSRALNVTVDGCQLPGHQGLN